MARWLNESDIGNVFRRVDRDQDKLLLLNSHNGDTVSFITFQFENGRPDNVRNMGYFNGPWFQECSGFSSEVISEIESRYEVVVAERLAELAAATDRNVRLNNDKRKKYNKPPSWEFVDTKPIAGHTSTEWIIWYDSKQHQYVVEVYDQSGLIANGTHSAGYEPKFGMDTNDVAAIYGDDGMIDRIVKSLE